MNNPDENRRVLEALLEAQVHGEEVALATITRARGSVPRNSGAKMVVYADGRIVGTVGGGEMESLVMREAALALEDGRPRVVPYSLVDPARGDPGICGGEVEIYVEPYLPPPTLLVIGCGHVGRAVAELGNWMGYRVAVSDDRAELATPEQTPGADVYLPGSIDETLAQLKVNRHTYVVATTRNAKIDRQILPKLVATEAPYIGVIGSRRRWAATQQLLQEDGLTAGQLARFHSPIGLEINAETPAEIALSIMAEITMLRRGGTGERMAQPAELNTDAAREAERKGH
jgi:xanthine dehydrogenase accessory factor